MFPECDDHFCYWCGELLTAENLTEDHLTPKARGGTDDPANVVPCCFTCNAQKSDKTADEYRRWRELMGLRSPQYSTYCFYLEELLQQFRLWNFAEVDLLRSLIRERLTGLQTRTTESNAEFIDAHITRLTDAVVKIRLKQLGRTHAMDKKPVENARRQELQRQLRQIGMPA